MKCKTVRSVVIIEDKEEDCESICRALADLLEVPNITIFRTGREALGVLMHLPDSAARSAGALPKLILLDFHLPKMRAPEVISALRTNPVMHTVPIVVLSDSCNTEDIQASYRSGANGFVCKPVDFVGFQDAVRLLGRYWLEFNQCPA